MFTAFPQSISSKHTVLPPGYRLLPSDSLFFCPYKTMKTLANHSYSVVQIQPPSTESLTIKEVYVCLPVFCSKVHQNITPHCGFVWHGAAPLHLQGIAGLKYCRRAPAQRCASLTDTQRTTRSCWYTLVGQYKGTDYAVKDVMRERIGMSNVLWVDLCNRLKKKNPSKSH